MTTSPRDDLPTFDLGTPAWCWLRLACSSTATLSCFTPQGRFSVDVVYTFGQDQLAIAVPSPDSVAWRAAGRTATLRINGTTHDQRRWSVRAAGHAHRAGAHLRAASVEGSAGSGPAWLALSSLQVRGRCETTASDGLVPEHRMSLTLPG